MRGPNRAAFCPSSSLRALSKHLGEEYFWIDAMRRVVRARVNATWFFQVRAEIARCGFLLNDGFFAASVLGIVGHHFERKQIDVAVGAIARTKASANAPILDDHLE